MNLRGEINGELQKAMIKAKTKESLKRIKNIFNTSSKTGESEPYF